MSKAKYLIINGDNIFPVYETRNGMVLAIHDKLDVNYPIEVKTTKDGYTWTPSNQMDLKEILMDLLPKS